MVVVTILAVVRYQHRLHALLLGNARHHGRQAEEAVGDVEGDDAARLHVPQVDAQRLLGDEVHRDGITRERVHRQHVEALRRLALEVEARIAQHHLDARLAVREVAEFLARHLDHLRIDVVEAVFVALAAVGGQRARAQADHADLHRAACLRRGDRRADARARQVVGGRLAPPLAFQVLLAVHDHAVHQAAQVIGAAGLAVFLDADRAIEIPLRHHHVLEQVRAVVGRTGGHRQQHRQARPARDHVHRREAHRGERRERQQREAELVVGVEDERRHHRDQQPADRAAGRNAEVEGGQVARRGPRAVELAVAEQAADEQA